MQTRQIEMDFTPGLTQQYRSLQEVCAACVYSSRKGLAGVAADLDMSPSTLTKILNKQDEDENTRNPPWRIVEGIIQSTNDRRPIYYLIEKYCEDADTKRQRALAELPALVETLQETMRVIGKGARR